MEKAEKPQQQQQQQQQQQRNGACCATTKQSGGGRPAAHRRLMFIHRAAFVQLVCAGAIPESALTSLGSSSSSNSSSNNNNNNNNDDNNAATTINSSKVSSSSSNKTTTTTRLLRGGIDVGRLRNAPGVWPNLLANTRVTVAPIVELYWAAEVARAAWPRNLRRSVERTWFEAACARLIFEAEGGAMAFPHSLPPSLSNPPRNAARARAAAAAAAAAIGEEEEAEAVVDAEGADILEIAEALLLRGGSDGGQGDYDGDAAAEEEEEEEEEDGEAAAAGGKGSYTYALSPAEMTEGALSVHVASLTDFYTAPICLARPAGVRFQRGTSLDNTLGYVRRYLWYRRSRREGTPSTSPPPPCSAGLFALADGRSLVAFLDFLLTERKLKLSSAAQAARCLKAVRILHKAATPHPAYT
jgi:hypothetical protein